MENLYPVTYKPNISIYKERNNYYQNKKEILQMITQETKTFIQCETYHHYKQELDNHIKHLIRYLILINILSQVKYY